MDRRVIADGFGQLVGQQRLGQRDAQGVEDAGEVAGTAVVGTLRGQVGKPVYGCDTFSARPAPAGVMHHALFISYFLRAPRRQSRLGALSVQNRSFHVHASTLLPGPRERLFVQQ